MERISHNNFEAINNNIEYINIRGNKGELPHLIEGGASCFNE